jgi:predicted RNase H-like HicB family nuclease
MDKVMLVLSENPESGWVSASAPALPGLNTQGKPRGEAIKNAREAVELWLDVDREGAGHRLPETPAVVAAGVELILDFREDFGWDLSIETLSSRFRMRRQGRMLG